MKVLRSAVIFTFCLILSVPAYSQGEAIILGTCMADSLTGKERKQLAKWIFFAIASHPEIKPYSSTTAEDIDQNDQAIGKLMTRLLTEDCPEKFVNAQKVDQLALNKAGEVVGQVAMQELMNDSTVTNSITSYVKYIDSDKIKSLFE